MPFLPSDLRNKLERTIIEGRAAVEDGARAALEALAVHHHEPYPHMNPAQRELRNHFRAAVTTSHAEFEKTYNEQMAALTASGNWKKLKADQRKQILADEGINGLPALSLGSEAALIRTLEQTLRRRGRSGPMRWPSSSPALRWLRQSCRSRRPSAFILPAEHSGPSRKSRRGWPAREETSCPSSRPGR